MRRAFTPIFIIIVVAAAGVAAVLAFGVLNIGGIRRSVPNSTGQTSSDPILNDLNVTGTSDKISDIEKDLDNTKLSSLDQELPWIDQDTSSL